MIRANKNLVFLFIYLSSFFWVACYNPGGVVGFQSFGWKPDGSGLVILRQNFDTYSYLASKEMMISNNQGQEIRKITLQKAISRKELSDNLYFTEDGKGFFAQIESDIYTVNSDDGTENLLIASQEFLAASPSGKLIFTKSIGQPSANDSSEYIIFSMIGGKPVVISKKKFINSSFTPYFAPSNIKFINDSLWATCFLQTNVGSLTIFDTGFKAKYSTNDSGCAVFITYASGSNELAYSSAKGFSILNLFTHDVRVINASPNSLRSMEISLNSAFIVYTLSEPNGAYYDPRTVILLDLKNNKENTLASGTVSSALLSPDGRSVAYCTKENRNVQIHVISVP